MGGLTIFFFFFPSDRGVFSCEFLFQNFQCLGFVYYQYSKPVLQPYLDDRVPVFCTYCTVIGDDLRDDLPSIDLILLDSSGTEHPNWVCIVSGDWLNVIRPHPALVSI